jgi:hypothetical protein
MRKNILLVSFVSAFLLTQTACEDGKDEFLDDFSTILYFRNSGEIPVSVYNTGEDANYQVVINKGGSELNAVTEVSIGTMDDAWLYIMQNRE